MRTGSRVETGTPPRWFPAAIVVLGWTAIGLASAGAAWANWVNEGIHISLGRSVLLSLPYWLFWAAVTPGITALADRWPVTRIRPGRALAVHLAAALACAVVHCFMYAATNKYWFAWPPSEHGGAGPPLRELFTSILYSRTQFDLIVYAAILGSVLALRFHRESEARALAAAELKAQLAQAQLAALRMQLNPHFLFNTLQAVSTLAVSQPRVAQRMLTRLGDLLRVVLDGDQRQEIPLAEELDFLRTYLDIEQTRFPDRLQVDFQVTPGAEHALVPSFILQPLVENAIRHGIAQKADAGRVQVAASREDGRLVLRVANDGPAPAGTREGLGLSTTRARLEKLYGDSQSLTLGVREGMTEASITLPYRPGHG